MAGTERELTSRIEVALKRIAYAVERISDGKESIDGDSALSSELVAEREKTRSLKADLEAERSRFFSTETQRASEIESMVNSLQRSRDELAMANQLNSELSRRCKQLKESLEATHSSSTAAEEQKTQIEQLKQARAGDLAELNAILAELRPLVENVQDA